MIATTAGLPERAGEASGLLLQVVAAPADGADDGHSAPAAPGDDAPVLCGWLFIVPAIKSYGFQRVMTALLGYLRDGTNPERAGAARAWYWARATESVMWRDL